MGASEVQKKAKGRKGDKIVAPKNLLDLLMSFSTRRQLKTINVYIFIIKSA